MATRQLSARDASSGFTLVELSIVLLILGILAKAAIMPLTAVQSTRLRQATDSELELIKQSLIAHVVATGVVPCPLSLSELTSASREAVCQQSQGGIPARELGIAGPLDNRGALLDAWNRPYQFAVSLRNHGERGDTQGPDWTTVGEASQLGIQSLSADITICLVSDGRDCLGHDVRSQQVVFAVWSSGQDASGAGAQVENLDGDAFLVAQAFSTHDLQPFDDHMVWATAADVIYWQLRAGWLP